MKLIDLTGERYGKLVVVKRIENMRGRTTWLCKCDCGNEKPVVGIDLRTGNTKSCGCSRVLHGHGKRGLERSTEYNIWNSMLQRCHNPKNKNYEFYGAKGVKVCEEWREFEVFLRDMGRRPSRFHTLDRIDVYGDYEPKNCKWSTRTEQDRNQRLRRTNKTGHKGVHYDKVNDKYRASIGVSGKTVQSKRFDTLDQAVEERRKMEIKYWGKASE